MSLTSDERDWLIRVENKLDGIAMNGCSRAQQHADHEVRIRTVEQNLAEQRGKAVVVNGMIATGISVVCVFIGRLFK